MLTIAVSSVFNGTDDGDIESVDMPKAYLRFLSSIAVSDILWLDSNYDPVELTSEQLSHLENGVQVATGGANA